MVGRRRFLWSAGATLAATAGCVRTDQSSARTGVIECSGSVTTTKSPRESSAIDAVRGRWPTEQYDARHTGHSPDARGPAECPTIQWTFRADRYDADNGINRQPAVGGGMVYATDNRQTLYAVDAATGQEQWRYTELGRLNRGPTLADGTLYVGTDTGLQAIDVDARTEQWYYSFGYGYGEGLDRGEYFPSGAPTVHDGTVYVGTNGGVVHAVDATTGEKRWTFTAPVRRPPGFGEIEGLTYDNIAGAISVSDGTAFFSSWNGHVYALDADTGRLRWSFDAKDQLEGAATLVGNNVYAAGDRNLYALDSADGTLRWKLNQASDDADVTRGSPAIADGTLYVGRGTSVENMNLAAVDAENGMVKWETPAVLQLLGNPTVANGVVYTPAGRLLALDAETGALRWAYDHDSTVGGAPPVVDGVLFAADYDGWLVAIA